MRLTGVWMVSMDQEHAFSGQYLLQFSIRLGRSTVVSRVFCEGLYAVWLGRRGGMAPYLKFLSNNSTEMFLGVKIT